ncbi:fibronectin type III-like domain-contianing protein [Paenibacillus sp. LjRoot153]
MSTNAVVDERTLREIYLGEYGDPTGEKAKGFAKVELNPYEKKEVSMTLDKCAFAYYNDELKDWHVETGEFAILVGKSSQDIILKDICRVESTVRLKKTYTMITTIGDSVR